MNKYKIILFGTGSSSEKIKKIINQERCEIVGYADNNKDKQGTYIERCYVYAPQQLLQVSFDYIVIGSIYFNEIYEQLIQLQIDAKKIVNIYEYIRYQDVKLKLKQLDEMQKPEMMITGMSYARYGFDMDALTVPAVNVSFNSQDIFYDLCLAQTVLEKFSTIRYALIGLAYYDFQFDLSLSKEKHLVNRYQIITDMQKKIDSKKFEQNILPHYEQQLFEVSDDILSLFIEDFIEKFDHLEQSKVNNRNLDEQRRELAITHSNKDYPATVQRNIALMERYFELLKQHNVTPIIVIHPQEEGYRKHFDPKMIKEFRAIIEKMAQKYTFEVIDLYNDSTFSDDDFYDVHHLNLQGANKVSKIVNGYIER
ncbi:MAG: D-alanyl-lipoteichoic acid biosynthesis protein DltD [Lysinibacillus sp.]